MSKLVTDAEISGAALLTNAVGLHARPSVKLTQLAKSFAATTIEVGLSADGPWVDAKSPVRIMRVKAGKGETLHFRAHGADAAKAVEALVDLVGRRFDEEETEPAGETGSGGGA